MPEKPSAEDATATLLRIERLLERIERHLAPPPLWQRLIKFVFQHFFVIASLLALAYFTWQIWQVIEAVLGNITTIRELVSGFADAFGRRVESLKPW